MDADVGRRTVSLSSLNLPPLSHPNGSPVRVLVVDTPGNGPGPARGAHVPEQKLNPVQGGPIWIDLSTHEPISEDRAPPIARPS
jgi:hypothetical protein